ncbi:SHOCT domain-containing protein [Arthrobacter sp. CJ23]|uniref:SHOCT domain-containing protein n=1 Tax=Arthrobacter sp. CJ23 TaxID=2972479 RepID=UPI00215D1D36|nr:SHOCT domain-containing protein [Arthrobacter sp. CJ23]UVJ41570.1 SHOCT domain-containing protein [Arthrobacter sp. CJ23]
MMWGYGMDMGWMWLWGLFALIGIALLVVLAVRLFSGGGYGAGGPQGPGGQPPFRSGARQILDERFAKGELTAEEYRERLRVLGEGP